MLQKIKSFYLLWYSVYLNLPKTHRYSLGQKIDTILIEIIEAIAGAAFLPPLEKQPYVRLAIKKADAVKLLFMILWECNSLDNKKYSALSAPLDEIGKMLGGWYGQIQKRNSLGAQPKEK